MTPQAESDFTHRQLGITSFSADFLNTSEHRDHANSNPCHFTT